MQSFVCNDDLRSAIAQRFLSFPCAAPIRAIYAAAVAVVVIDVGPGADIPHSDQRSWSDRGIIAHSTRGNPA